MGFRDLKVIPVKSRLVFGSQGRQEYFAVSFEEHILASLVHLHIRNVNETERPIEQRPYHTYLLADAPDWARATINTNKLIHKEEEK